MGMGVAPMVAFTGATMVKFLFASAEDSLDVVHKGNNVPLLFLVVLASMLRTSYSLVSAAVSGASSEIAAQASSAPPASAASRTTCSLVGAVCLGACSERAMASLVHLRGSRGCLVKNIQAPLVAATSRTTCSLVLVPLVKGGQVLELPPCQWTRSGPGCNPLNPGTTFSRPLGCHTHLLPVEVNLACLVVGLVEVEPCLEQVALTQQCLEDLAVVACMALPLVLTMQQLAHLALALLAPAPALMAQAQAPLAVVGSM